MKIMPYHFIMRNGEYWWDFDQRSSSYLLRRRCATGDPIWEIASVETGRAHGVDLLIQTNPRIPFCDLQSAQRYAVDYFAGRDDCEVCDSHAPKI